MSFCPNNMSFCLKILCLSVRKNMSFCPNYHVSVRKGKRGRPAAFFRLPIWKFLKQ